MKSPLNPKVRYEAAMRECSQHLLYLNLALEHTTHLFPLSIDSFKSLSNTDMAFLDQIVFRFTKLQDAIGNKLINHGLRLLDEQIEEQSMIDKLNTLERLRIIERTSDWLSLRELRNELTHEYPEDEQPRIDALNAIKEKTSILEETVSNLNQFILKRGL